MSMPEILSPSYTKAKSNRQTHSNSFVKCVIIGTPARTIVLSVCPRPSIFTVTNILVPLHGWSLRHLPIDVTLHLWVPFNSILVAPLLVQPVLVKQKQLKIWQKVLLPNVLSSTVQKVLITRSWVDFSLVLPSLVLGPVLMSLIVLISKSCLSLPNKS